MLRWLAATAIVLFCSTDAAAQSPRVIDGDTLAINGVTYRLEGIDAPELHQRCAHGWFAGVESAAFLRKLVRGGASCSGSALDVYGRTLATCTAGGWDLGYLMVRSGAAYSYAHYSQRYVVAELQAESEGLGVHWHGCEKPWKWRRKHETHTP